MIHTTVKHTSRSVPQFHQTATILSRNCNIHAAGITDCEFRVHGLRATAATNALEHGADIAKVQAWLGHASVATTRLYDKRESRPKDSPTFKVSYS
ncbi:site-specific tyrosine recombinase XerC [Phycisphaerae bacterium RAS1]|nr:site-specific tyrosine recombinase XerC [Phycisphaerae bacterium RAS1]